MALIAILTPFSVLVVLAATGKILAAKIYGGVTIIVYAVLLVLLVRP